MSKRNKKVPRWTGKPEVWFSKDLTKVLIRETQYSAEYIDLANERFGWKFVAFKYAWTFEFFNGSQYLTDLDFKLIERL